MLAPSGEITTKVTSAPLQKNAELQLAPGEAYDYNYSSGNSSQVVYFSVGDWFGKCLRIGAVMKQAGATGEACIAKNGSVFYGVLHSPQGDLNWTNMDFFQEWMLALSENWTWSVVVERDIPKIGLAGKEEIKYSCIGAEKKFGRNAFHVRAESLTGLSGPSAAIDYWVDAEKRILLEMNSSSAGVVLASAPFPLEKP
jgi:hypothetical protein